MTDNDAAKALKYWWSDDEEIIRSEAFETREQAYSDAYCSRADCFDNPEADVGFYLHHGKMVDNPDFDEEAYKHYGFDESNFPQLFEGKTEIVSADEVNDFFHDEWVKLSKEFRTALTKSAKVDGLLEVLKFYADPQNQAKEYTQSGCGIIFDHGSAYSNDKGERARLEIQRFNGEG